VAELATYANGAKHPVPWDDSGMRTRLKTYTAYGIGSAVAWLVILAIATGAADESKRRTIRLTCADWWLGWLSATIARQVYPPPLRWRAPS
jgi:hypothetical protein